MAHLIKLEDYVSRYQFDMYRYPSQFSRLKRDRWNRLKNEWEMASYQKNVVVVEEIDEQKSTLKEAVDKIKRWYKRDAEDEGEEVKKEVQQLNFQFKYLSLEELKQTFLRELYEFQLNWASSTIRETSHLKKQYYYDPTLKWFLQSFPDNYFILYYPTVTYPKATVQFDIILVGPTDIWCIVQLNGSENTIFQTESERYWKEKKSNDYEKKIINPFLSLNRMSTIIKRMLADAQLDLLVKKAVLTPKGFIDVEIPYHVATVIDQRNMVEWNEKMKSNSSPIKSVQLKFSQFLLDACQTTSVARQEFAVEEDDIDYEQ